MTAPSPVATAEDLICSVLRGETPAEADAAAAPDFEERAAYHGVEALLYERLKGPSWPAGKLDSLRSRAFGQAVWEPRHQQLLTLTLSELVAADIQPVLIKGTPLAYTHYPDPALRTRADTDLIIAPAQRHRAHQVLSALGFARETGVTGELVSYQSTYSVAAPEGTTHAFDLHWKINNSELLSKLFTHEELRSASVTLPQLGPNARGACDVHALLIACMHRASHKQNPYHVGEVTHYGGDRLIWLYDLHLLAGALGETQWTEFLRQAGQKGLRAVCAEGLEQAIACFHTVVPPAIMAGLRGSGPRESASRYLESGKLRQQWMDFCSLGGMGDRFRLLRETVFPPETYMRARYGQQPAAGLTGLYMRRAASGLLKRLRRADRA